MAATQYFWRVKTTNICGDSVYSSVFNFTTVFDTDNDGGQYNNEGGGGTDIPYPNIYVYLFDSNGDPVGYTTTDSTGKYVFDVPDGTYTVRYGSNAPALQGLTPTYEGGGAIDGEITVVLVTTSEHNDFGFFASMDCGDLPEGIRHY